MGYDTTFAGQFKFNRPLAPTHLAYLTRFAQVCHMRWHEKLLVNEPDPLRTAIGYPIGQEGLYYTGEMALPDFDFQTVNRHPAMIDVSRPARGAPGLWCQWIPSADGQSLVWDGIEKFYDYGEWLHFLIEHFFKSWDYKLSGRVTWQGEDDSDRGVIVVDNNIIEILDTAGNDLTAYYISNQHS